MLAVDRPKLYGRRYLSLTHLAEISPTGSVGGHRTHAVANYCVIARLTLLPNTGCFIITGPA